MNRILISCAALVCALGLLTPASAQAPAPAPPPSVPGGLNLNNASLLEVINMLMQDLHLNYILDAGVRGGSVTMNTYGTVRDVDLRPLLETILRMNNLAMVQAGNMYRIVPIASITRQPISPIHESDPSKLPEDERILLNLVFLRYMSSAEMGKILNPFIGDGAQMIPYDGANLLMILDNSRNMRRTLELINLFDSDTFAGQRVHSYEVKNGRPTDVVKELEEVFKAYAMAGDKGNSPIHFLPIDRINSILAVSPNPASFDEVSKWIAKLDIPARVTAGSIDNYVYRLRYARAEVMGSVVMQLYGGSGYNLSAGIYGGVTGSSSYPATGSIGGVGGVASGYGGAGGGFNNGGQYNGGYNGGAQYQNTGQFGAQAQQYPSAGLATLATGGIPATAPGVSAADRTGAFLGTPTAGNTGYQGPRIIPNPFDNTLLVQGTPQQWEQIRHLLEQLDVPPRQVLIDAKIYEIDLSGDLTWGVESFLQKAGTANATVPSHQLLGTASSAGLGLTAGTLVGQSRQLLAYLQANETTSKTKVLSAPSIIATDSIPASITVGSTVPTLTSTSATGVESGGTSLFANTISNTSTGISLTVLARVNPSGVVTMVINQNVTAPLATSTSNIDSPSFSQRNVSTQVTVEDGDTIAIGGIITDNDSISSSGIPFLDRIPYIGAAFGSKTKTTSRTELIVFLTPRVIYDTTQMSEATNELKDKLKDLRKFIEKE